MTTMNDPKIVNICPKCKRPGTILEDPNVDAFGYYSISYSHEDGTICNAGRAIQMDRLIAESVPNITKPKRRRQEPIIAPCPICLEEGRHFVVARYPNKERWICYHPNVQEAGYYTSNGQKVQKSRRCKYFKITDPNTGKISIIDKIPTENPVIETLCPKHKTMTRCYTNFHTTKGGIRVIRRQYEHRDGKRTLRPDGTERWPRCSITERVEGEEKKQEQEQPQQQEQQKKMTKTLIAGINRMLYNKFRIEAIQNCKIKEAEAIEQALILWMQDSIRKRTPELSQGPDLSKRKALEATCLQLKNAERQGGEPFKFLTYKRHS